MWYSLLHSRLLVMPCSLVDKHQTFTENFASISANDRGSRLIRNGASLPDYTALQLATQWLSTSSSSIWTHWGPKHHHLEQHFDTDACEQVNYFQFCRWCAQGKEGWLPVSPLCTLKPMVSPALGTEGSPRCLSMAVNKYPWLYEHPKTTTHQLMLAPFCAKHI